MSEVLVTRRPVFDRSLDLAAYEIAVVGEDDGGAGDAVSRLVLDVAAGGAVESILGNRPAWLRLSRTAALESAAREIALSSVMVELRPAPGDEDGLRRAVQVLHAKGYTVAADGLAHESLLPEVDIAIVDLGSHRPDELAKIVERLKQGRLSLAATNVESPELHDAAQGLGFDLFRGNFFAKPRISAGEGVPPSRLAVLRLLAALQNPDVELADVVQLVSQDVALTYRLLRYINSAFFGLRREVSSLSHAVQLLGLKNIKRWATVVMLANVDHRPREILTTALVRGRFCELIGPSFGERSPDALFTLGLFSVLDVLMEMPMARALRPLPLGGDMVEALTLGRGTKGKILACALAVERGEEPSRAAGALPKAKLAELHREALTWATETAQTL